MPSAVRRARFPPRRRRSRRAETGAPLPLPNVRGAQAPSFDLKHAPHDGRLLEQKRLELVVGDDQAAQERRRDYIGGWRLVGQDRDLAEEVAAGEPGALL